MKKLYCIILFLTLTLWAHSQIPTNNYILTRTMCDSLGVATIDQIQYYDGLGRPYLAVLKGAAGGNRHLASLQEYDTQGRNKCIWLPVCIEQEYNNSYDLKKKLLETYQDSLAYTSYDYHTLPLDRVTWESGPGKAWVGKGIKNDYFFNIASPDSVLSCKKYSVTDGGGRLLYDGYYKANSLSVVCNTDEDGYRSYTFKDSEGRVLLVRSCDGNVFSDTYFVYDSFGRLCYVLPPSYQENEDLDLWAYQYSYDGLGRCIKKKYPGCDEVSYVYDNADRIICSEDGVQHSRSHYTAYAYDVFGRLTSTTEMTRGSNGGRDLVNSCLRKYYDNYDFLYTPELSVIKDYTLMRYLQYNTLQQKGLTHFDAWASTFGETTTAIELAPEGTGYRARTRFAKFFNLPELMAMFKEAADIKTSDQLHLPVPDAKFETVVVKPSEIQQDMVQALSERAAEVHSGSVAPSVDNMLKITSDGRKIGLDQRLMNSALPDDPNSKLNACVNNVLRIWNDTKEQKLTQLIFCDMSTPKGDGSFNVYDDIRTKLLNAGVPEQEIEFIHNADTENKKAELFSKVRSGQVRVLLGSTAKMGAGTNVQTLLVAVHHLDVGWRPSDMTQRNGRIIRQGNQNKQVYVYNYVTESTFDAYLYQTLENKQKFISQIMTSKSPMRSCDDIDEQALSYAEIKALCAGDPRIREKMDLDVQVAKLKVLRGDFQNQKYRLEDKLLKTFPEEIQKQKTRITALQQDSQIAAAHPQDKENFCGMTIKGMVYDDKKAAGERLLLARQEMPNADMMLLGTYRGFELNIRFDSFKNEHQAVLRAELSYPVSLGDDARGNITRLDNAIDNFADRIADAENARQNLEQQKQAAEVEVAKPFAQEEELAEKSARLAELNALLNIDRDRSSSQDAPEETEETETPATRPSVLAALGEKTNQPEPVKPFRSYYNKDGDAR